MRHATRGRAAFRCFLPALSGRRAGLRHVASVRNGPGTWRRRRSWWLGAVPKRSRMTRCPGLRGSGAGRRQGARRPRPAENVKEALRREPARSAQDRERVCSSHGASRATRRDASADAGELGGACPCGGRACRGLQPRGLSGPSHRARRRLQRCWTPQYRPCGQRWARNRREETCVTSTRSHGDGPVGPAADLYSDAATDPGCVALLEQVTGEQPRPAGVMPTPRRRHGRRVVVVAAAR